jgi:hypothetical protein
MTKTRPPAAHRPPFPRPVLPLLPLRPAAAAATPSPRQWRRHLWFSAAPRPAASCAGHRRATASTLPVETSRRLQLEKRTAVFSRMAPSSPLRPGRLGGFHHAVDDSYMRSAGSTANVLPTRFNQWPGSPAAGWEIVPSYDAKCLVAYLMSLDQSHPLAEVRSTAPASPPAPGKAVK